MRHSKPIRRNKHHLCCQSEVGRTDKAQDGAGETLTYCERYEQLMVYADTHTEGGAVFRALD